MPSGIFDSGLVLKLNGVRLLQIGDKYRIIGFLGGEN
jgi:hypothetical protein